MSLESAWTLYSWYLQYQSHITTNHTVLHLLDVVRHVADYKVHSYTLGFCSSREARLHKDKLKELRNFTSLPVGGDKLRLMYTYTIDVVSRDQDLYAGDITVSKVEEGRP